MENIRRMPEFDYRLTRWESKCNSPLDETAGGGNGSRGKKWLAQATVDSLKLAAQFTELDQHLF